MSNAHVPGGDNWENELMALQRLIGKPLERNVRLSYWVIASLSKAGELLRRYPDDPFLKKRIKQDKAQLAELFKEANELLHTQPPKQ